MDGARDSYGRRLRAVAETLGAEVGTRFLESLVAALRDAMQADLVLIGMAERLPAERTRVTFALRNGAPAESFSYDLRATPCHEVYGGATVVVPCDLARRFPREGQREGYVGIPLRDRHGATVGHFAVFSDAPIAAPQTAADVMRIFAMRIEADLHYRTLLAERDGLIADLTGANRTLRERSKALHAANQFKTSLLAMIAHDLRNPLAVIVSSVELMQARLAKPELDRDRAGRDLSKIMRAADRLTGLVEATLTRCKRESQGIVLALRSTDVAALVAQAIDNNRDAAEAKGITVVSPVRADCLAALDPGLCLEAVDNLISNAVKYSPPQTGITVSVETRDGCVRIAVADQGLGLTAADLERAFLPYQTLSARPTGGETATGLGLSNVRQIARAHGGDVCAASPGQGLGATFTLRLPLDPEPDAAGA